MAKAAVNFACTECGYSAGRWFGNCPGCGTFGTLVEEAPAAAAAKCRRQAAASPRRRRGRGGGADPDRRRRARPRPRRRARPGVARARRRRARRRQVDAAADGARRDLAAGRRALLVTGEESAAQVKLRAARLGGTDGVEILAETELDAVCATLERERPDVCVIDSVQTLYAAELGSAPGSVGQVREAAGRLLRVAKEHGVAMFLVGHVTKDGAVAGPRVLEHLVDCVLQFEGDRYHAHRVLRAAKNRFGSTNELGVFEMTGDGPRRRARSVRALRPDASTGEVGAAVACALEGTRPILLEIQALVAPTDLAMPRRVATGVDPKRLAMIVAVLSRHAGVALGPADVFVNVAGGVAHRRARRRPRDRARDRLGRARRAGARGRRGLRRDRPHRPPAAGRAGRAPARGVRQARLRRRGRAGRTRRSRAQSSTCPRPGHAARGPRGRARARGRRKIPRKSALSRPKTARFPGVSAMTGQPHAGEPSSPPAFSLNRRFSRREREAGLYKVGDKVVYPHHGAGTVVKKEKREVLGQKREYLTIQILHNDMTVNVPAENAEKVGLRKVIDEEIVKKVVKALTAGERRCRRTGTAASSTTATR